MTNITEQGSDTILDRVVHTYEGKVLVYQPGDASDIRLTIQCDGGIGAHVGNGPFQASVWMEDVGITELTNALQEVQARRMQGEDMGAASRGGLLGTIRRQQEREAALRAELAQAQERIAKLELQVDSVLQDRRQAFEDGFRMGFANGASVDLAELPDSQVELTASDLVRNELANVKSLLEDSRHRVRRLEIDRLNSVVQHEIAVGFNSQLSHVFNAARAVVRVCEAGGQNDVGSVLSQALHGLQIAVRNITALGGATLAEECVGWTKLWLAARKFDQAIAQRNKVQQGMVPALQAHEEELRDAVRSLSWLVPAGTLAAVEDGDDL